MIYSSPVIHTVTLTDLAPGEVYEYELADGVRAFRLPPATYPVRLGLAADVGQTVVSNRSFEKLAALDPDVVFCVEIISELLSAETFVSLNAIEQTQEWRRPRVDGLESTRHRADAVTGTSRRWRGASET